jgi:hypothetical protein
MFLPIRGPASQLTPRSFRSSAIKVGSKSGTGGILDEYRRILRKTQITERMRDAVGAFGAIDPPLKSSIGLVYQAVSVCTL